MGLKELFDNPGDSKLAAKKSLEEIGAEAESADYAHAYVEDKNRFVPHVDFSKPENFAYFGSAEQYYENAIKRIYQFYPYDGSLKEKIHWHLTSSYFDNHVFENEYPRTTGYAILTPAEIGASDVADSIGQYQGFGTSSYQYIQVKGGPHKDASNTALSDIYPSEGGTANVYSTSSNRESNLKYDLQDNGVTVEFWLKKNSFFGDKEVVFDLWNGEVSSSEGYGRLRIELSGTAESDDDEYTNKSPWRITGYSGSTGFYDQQIGSSSATTVTTGSLATWKHYAFSFLSASKGTKCRFYVNGALNDERVVGTNSDNINAGFNEITGTLIANIGALRHAPSGASFIDWEMEGWGRLSASIDEFRYWKTQRSSEKIGRFWFGQVGAGTNTDTANTDIGVYYKFNEGITSTGSTDNVVLDYSGRVSNGTWTGYVGNDSRNTGSAMVSGGFASSEFEDPIIRINNNRVKQYINVKRDEGREYDHTNNASLYYTLPEWIIAEDHSSKEKNGELLKLIQIMSSYLDNLHLQVEAINHIQDINYLSSSNEANMFKPLPFANKLLTSRGFVAPELFTDSTILENFLDRQEDRELEAKLHDTKNFIYQNVYNNLISIYKKKGTEESFRNLIRCFGIDDNLVKVNLYADGATYELEDSHREVSIRKSLVDFSAAKHFEATVYQNTDSNNSNTVSFITGSHGTQEANLSMTVEAEIIFPKKKDVKDRFHVNTPFITSSLFGMHTAKSEDSENLSFHTPDETNFQIYAIRNDTNSKHARFMLSSSDGGHINEGFNFHHGETRYKLTSSVYSNVYNEERWLLAFRMRKTKSPYVGEIDGVENDTYNINFYGANPRFGFIENEFELTGTISGSKGDRIMKNPKRIFAGAHRTNFTGSVIDKTDVKVGSVRVWYNYLDNDVLKAHAIDPLNYGHNQPFKRAFLFEDNVKEKDIKNIETLALNWDFQTLTSSNASGEFVVPDFSSGSTTSTSRHGYLSNIINNQHSGRGTGFTANSTASIDVDYMHAYAYQLPEVLSNKDTVQILDKDDHTYFRDKRPIKFHYSVEKSLYQDISLDMLNMFSTMKDFHNLIGEPVNRYRPQYKDLEKLRQLYFERVRNTPEFEKFVDFYKWFDDALGQMILELVPASSRFSKGVRNMVESHILERNKYWTKFPTLEAKGPTLDSGINSNINQPTAHGLAPPPVESDGAPINQGNNADWWAAIRDVAIAPSGDDNVDSDRQQLFDVLAASNIRSRTSPVRLQQLNNPAKDSDIPQIPLGPTAREAVRAQLSKAAMADSTIELSVVESDAIVKDSLDKNQKGRISTKAMARLSQKKNIKGPLLAPFSVFSSSANPHLQIIADKEITNIHKDGRHYGFESHIQGPFTDQHVGGLQHRHVGLNNISGDSDVLDDELSRPEGFRITIQNNTASINSPEKNSAGSINMDLPRAQHHRDETAKRPLNVRNIKNVTGTMPVLGNYKQDYEIVQTSNRKINNRYFVEDQASVDTVSPVILFDTDGFATSISASSTYISGVMDYEKPSRGRNKHVIVERFSAPGGPETSGDADGGPGLDALSAEYSVYNTINYRNTTVRVPLNEFSTDHCGQFGLDKDYTLGSTAQVSASFHKIHRNQLKRMELSNGSVATASVYDNFFVQHPIPRSDLQYLWISSSVAQSSPPQAPFGFAKDPRTFPADAEVVTFLTTGQVSAGSNFVDFVGLNTLVHEPVNTSTNTISASKNESLASLATAEVLNASLLNRNGPYGYPMWKQFRTAEHPIARHQRKNNIIDYIREPSNADYKTFVRSGITYKVGTPDSQRRKTFSEPVVSSVHKPITHGLLVKNEQTNKYMPVSLKHTYQNNISHFSNTALDRNLKNITNSDIGSVKYSQIYDSIKDLYIENAGSSDQLFVYVNIFETIYPRAKNAYMSRTRSRPEYNVKTVLGWRSTRSDRDTTGTSDSQGNSSPPTNQSSWPLDARYNEGSFINGTAFMIYTPTGTSLNTQNDGAGELLNAYTQFHCGLPAKIAPAPLYARREPEYMTGSNELGAGSIAVAGGDTKWEVGAQAGIGPFYDTYGEYSEEIKRIGKDYTIVPEFRISDHIEYYIEENNKDFVGTNLPDDLFKLDGAHLSSSAVTGSIFDNSFFSLYNHSDFIEMFEQVHNDHKEYDGKLNTNLTLQCNAITKFRPREGFYPAQRTLQLASLFSQSYAPAVEFSGSPGANESWRTALQPFYAPGILYNTIKSGLAVDFPVMTGSSGQWSSFVKRDSDTYSEEEKYGYFPEAFLPKDMNRMSASFHSLTNNAPIHKYYFISSSFDHRIPFEGIIDPIALGDMSKIKYADIEPHPSAALDSFCTFRGQSKELHKLAINNFLAETVNFYLKNRQMTFFASTPSDTNGITFDTDKEYVMDIKISRDTKLAVSGATNLMNGPLKAEHPEIYEAVSSSYYKSIEMYERESAFGPPVLELSITGNVDASGVQPSKRWAFFSGAPYTPPYYDGYARVRYSFQPTSNTHTLEEVVKNSTKKYFRSGILSGTYPKAKWGISGSYAYVSAMQISSSINLNTVLRTRTVELDKEGRLQAVIDQPGSKGYQWVIEPKFETPILDFSASSVTLPVSGSGSVSRGMWHQYGSIPFGSSKGVFLSLEFPKKDITNTQATASLLQACGFDTYNQTLSKKLGELSDSTMVSEAVIAIPFVSKTKAVNNLNDIEFLKLTGYKDPKKAKDVIKRALEGEKVPDSISNMVSMIQKYVLPPKFDFIKFDNIDPFVMYIFEFEHEFTKNDLKNMWQNTSPATGRGFKNLSSQVSHDVKIGELFGNKEQKRSIGDLRWLVFKVKQRAEKFYNNKTLASFDDLRYAKSFGADSMESIEQEFPYSYNWPYDYFSLIELVKINAGVTITDEENYSKAEEEQ